MIFYFFYLKANNWNCYFCYTSNNWTKDIIYTNRQFKIIHDPSRWRHTCHLHKNHYTTDFFLKFFQIFINTHKLNDSFCACTLNKHVSDNSRRFSWLLNILLYYHFLSEQWRRQHVDSRILLILFQQKKCFWRAKISKSEYKG